MADSTGQCDPKEELWDYASKTLDRLGGKNDVEAIAQIVERGASLFHSYKDLMPALTGVFLGIDESNPLTILNAARAGGCAGLGREPKDCKANSGTATFGDAGFNPDFQDTHDQVYHFWAYVATAAATDDPVGGYAPAWFTGNGANIAHEIGGVGEVDAAKSGASWEDYALAQEGMNTGTLIAFGMIPPGELGDYIRQHVGTGSSGSPYVGFMKQNFPLGGDLLRR